MDTYTCSYMLLNASYTCYIYYQMIGEWGDLSSWTCMIPPPCFGKHCCVGTALCQPFFALSCPQTGGFLPHCHALWCLPRYHCRYRKPGTSFLRPSQDACIAWEFSRCQLCFLMILIWKLLEERSTLQQLFLRETSLLSLKPESPCSLPFSHCMPNKEVLT